MYICVYVCVYMNIYMYIHKYLYQTCIHACMLVTTCIQFAHCDPARVSLKIDNAIPSSWRG